VLQKKYEGAGKAEDTQRGADSSIQHAQRVTVALSKSLIEGGWAMHVC